MKLLDALKNLIGLKAVEESANDTSAIARQFIRDRVFADRSQRGALEAYHESPILRMAVSTIADSIASNGWRVVNEVSGDEAEDHPALDVFRRPNSLQSGYIFQYVVQAYLELAGEALLLVVNGDANDLGFELLPVPPNAGTLQKTRDGTLEWEIKFGDFERTLPDSRVVQLRDPKMGNPYGRGHGMAQTLADELQIDNKAAKHIKAEVTNHGRPDGLVIAPGASPEETQTLKDRWYEEYGGPQNAGKIMFTSGSPEAALNFVELNRSLADMEALNLRDAQKELTRQGYSIPPEVLGDAKDSNRATAEAAYYLYSKSSLQPRLRLLASELNMKLMPLLPRSEGHAFEPVNPVPEDKEFIRSMMVDHPGAYKVNEARRLTGHEPVDGGDDETLADVQPAAGGFGGGFDAGGEDGEAAVSAAETKDVGITIYTKAEQDSDAEQVAEEATNGDEVDEKRTAVQRLIEDQMAGFVNDSIAEIDDPIDLDEVRPGLTEAAEARMREVWQDKIDQTTRDAIKDTILDGFREGKGVREIRDDLASKLDQFSKGRAKIVAHTESHSMANRARHEHQKASRVIEKKHWLHPPVADEPRDHHERLEQETRENPIPVDQPFETRGKTAMYPGGFGSAKEDASCHCGVAHVVDESLFEDEDSKGWSDAKLDQWRHEFKASVQEARKALRPTVVDYFELQRERALAAFDRIIAGKA